MPPWAIQLSESSWCHVRSGARSEAHLLILVAGLTYGMTFGQQVFAHLGTLAVQLTHRVQDVKWSNPFALVSC